MYELGDFLWSILFKVFKDILVKKLLICNVLNCIL